MEEGESSRIEGGGEERRRGTIVEMRLPLPPEPTYVPGEDPHEVHGGASMGKGSNEH